MSRRLLIIAILEAAVSSKHGWSGDLLSLVNGKHAALSAVEFLRRLLLHVLPKGFVRIRHYGLLASGNVTTKLRAAHRLLHPGPSTEAASSAEHGVPTDRDADELPHYVRLYRELTGVDLRSCPACRSGRLVPLPLAPAIRGPP